MDEQEQQQPTKYELHLQKRAEQKHINKVGAYMRLAKKMLLMLFIFGGAMAVVFGLVKWAGTSAPQTTIALDAVSLNDWLKGNKDSSVTLVEYSDFQCPACKSYMPLIKQLLADYEDRVRFVYRHFPLSQHKNAEPAAYASEAAGKQGKFWEMHDMIFDKQSEWAEKRNAEETFAEYAKTLGLDIAQFTQDTNNKELRDKVDADFKSGVSAGVNSTPTFFLNGKKMIQPRSVDEFKQQIDAISK